MNCNKCKGIQPNTAAVCTTCHDLAIAEAYRRGKSIGRLEGMEEAAKILDTRQNEAGAVANEVEDIVDVEMWAAVVGAEGALGLAADAIRRALSPETQEGDAVPPCPECGSEPAIGEAYCADCLDGFDSTSSVDRMETPRDYGYDGSGF